MAETTTTSLSENELAIYDRQIRLWGLQSQRRIRSANILFCGFRGLNAEICKNLVLAGVSVTVQDSDVVQAQDLGANFFLRPCSIGKNRAEAAVGKLSELNPLIKVESITKPLSELSVEDIKKYTLVCVSEGALEEKIRINRLCRECSIGFFLVGALGIMAFMFCDLGESYKYLLKESSEKVNADGEKEFVYKEKTMNFCTLQDALSVSFQDLVAANRVRKRKRRKAPPMAFVLDFLIGLHVVNALKKEDGFAEEKVKEALNSLLKKNSMKPEVVEDVVNEKSLIQLAEAAHFGTELSPICATVGGIVGQEFLKAISGKDSPINNFFFFNGTTGNGVVKKVAPTTKK